MRRTAAITRLANVDGVGTLPADDDLRAECDAAQIALVKAGGNAARILAQGIRHRGPRPFAGDADPFADPELGPPEQMEPGECAGDLLRAGGELIRFSVSVPADAAAGVRPHAVPPASEQVPRGDLERCDGDGVGDAEIEDVAVVDEHPVTVFLETRNPTVDEDLLRQHDAPASAEHDSGRGIQHRLEALGCGKPCGTDVEERVRLDRLGAGSTSRQQDRGCDHQPHEALAHFANPMPRTAARALTRPKPYSWSRPGVPRSVALRSSADSTAAALVMPCA